MKKKILAATLGLSLLGFSFANAGDNNMATTGVVFGAQAGFAAGFNPPDLNGASGSTTNAGFNFGGFVGYDVAVSKMFAVGAEVGINYTPDMYKINIDGLGNADLSLLNIPIMATAKFYTPIGLNVFAKGGLNFQNADVSGSCSLGSICSGSQSNNNWTGVLAGGIGYKIQQLNIFAQYMYVFGNDLDNYSDSKAVAQGILTGGVSFTLPM